MLDIGSAGASGKKLGENLLHAPRDYTSKSYPYIVIKLLKTPQQEIDSQDSFFKGPAGERKYAARHCSPRDLARTDVPGRNQQN